MKKTVLIETSARHIHVSRDGVVAIAENADTSKANTEYADWKGDVRYVDRGAD